MHKYKAPVQTVSGNSQSDQRSPSRRTFDSVYAKVLRVLSVVFAVYAPIAMLFGVVLIMAPIDLGVADEAEFISRRREYGTAAIIVVISGFLAAFGSYRLWIYASRVRRRNLRRSKGLE